MQSSFLSLSKRVKFVFLLSIPLLLLCWLPATQAATDCNAVTEIPVSECRSLLELYNSTNGPNWKNNTGWNQTYMPCNWHGITCSAGHVTEINLSDDDNSDDNPINGNGLVGQIPDLNLPELTLLSLSNGQLSGNIPNFSKLPNLKDLLLFENQLSGNIPNFSNLPNLEGLNLRNNQLSGNIPNNFVNFYNLTALTLSNNQLSGSIPDFSNLPKLTYILLWSNQLSGSIPNFSNLPSLKFITFSGNQLSGNIPDFGSSPNLEEIDLDNNLLNGNIPNFGNLPRLRRLALYSNQLSGSIPNFNLPKLVYFGASWNQLSGSIPNFSNLPSLRTLELDMNQLSGNIPSFNSLNLMNLRLSNNQLNGTIPNFTAFNLANLVEVSFYNNCGLITYDDAQESILDSKDPYWQVRNPDCSVSENQPPIASFTVSANSGIAPLKVQVDASSSNDPDGSITWYEWQTSNGLSAGGFVNTSVYFATAGNYTITLEVTDNDGLTAKTQRTVIVTEKVSVPDIRIEPTTLVFE